MFGFAMFTSKWEWILFQSPAVDCGDPGTPTNGQRTLSSTTYNSVVTYTCDVGYTLQGSNSRTCQSDGQWSGSVPPCNRKFIFEYNLTFTIVLFYVSVCNYSATCLLKLFFKQYM